VKQESLAEANGKKYQERLHRKMALEQNEQYEKPSKQLPKPM
jgi:hypothetical protein